MAITVRKNDDGTFTERNELPPGITWVRDSYTEPRESLFECGECEKDIEEEQLFTCLDGGEAAHVACVQIEDSDEDGAG